MSHYNLAYCPLDGSFTRTCITFAYTELRNLADGFLLNQQNSLPHVTLVQFDTEETQLDLMWEQAAKVCNPHHSMVLDGLRLRESRRTGHTWVELSVSYEPILLEMQNNVAKALNASGAELFTPSGEGYSPHLSLARLKRAPDSMPVWPDKTSLTRPQPFHLALGLSDANSVYVKKLKAG